MKNQLLSLLYAFVAVTAFSRYALAEDTSLQNRPKLIEQAVALKGIDSAGLKRLILDNNRYWTNPEPGNISYTFSMKHVDKNDLWQATVNIVPDTVSIRINDGAVFSQTMDNKYDPYNNAYPPKLLTLSQGISFFGPLHKLCWTPADADVKLVSQGIVNGKHAWIGQIAAHARDKSGPVPKWLDDLLRLQATRSTYLYEFTPVNDVDGKLIIAIKCLHAQGPGWADISKAHKQNPSRILWGGKIISAQMRDFRGKDTPVIVIDKDASFTGQSPITAQTFNTGVDNMTDRLTLGEGPRVIDDAVLEHLKEKQMDLRLSLRVGCGIFRTWYGSSGGPIETDQVSVEKETGLILKEEGFCNGQCSFVATYEEYEEIDCRCFPKHVVVTLYQTANSIGTEGLYPWIFDMRFDIHQRKVWLLKTLTEIKTATKIDTTAEITNVALK